MVCILFKERGKGVLQEKQTTNKQMMTFSHLLPITDHADCVTHLVAAKADTRKSTPTKKMTALLIATAANNAETVKRMAQGGVDLDYCGKDGQTALMLAAEVSKRMIIVVWSKFGESGFKFCGKELC